MEDEEFVSAAEAELAGGMQENQVEKQKIHTPQLLGIHLLVNKTIQLVSEGRHIFWWEHKFYGAAFQRFK